MNRNIAFGRQRQDCFRTVLKCGWVADMVGETVKGGILAELLGPVHIAGSCKMLMEKLLEQYRPFGCTEKDNSLLILRQM